jgi:ribosomal protein S12 methylthiotransferase accessory factor
MSAVAPTTLPTPIPIERGVSISVAQMQLEAALRARGIVWEILVAGRHIKTAKCVLRDEHGTYLEFGYGKGREDSAIAGAMFEAAEHWFCQPSNCDRGSVEYRDSGDFLRMTPLPKSIPLEIISKTPRATMAFRKYKNLSNQQEILYPLALSAPKYIDSRYENSCSHELDTFDYSSLERYCSNSGVAIGSSVEEAIVHGLLESVERDSLSRFLVKVFLNRDPFALRVLRAETVPVELRELWVQACREVGHEVMVVELENKYGVPTFCATLVASKYELEVAGFGSSLSRDHAFSRALHELVQCFHANDVFHPDLLACQDAETIARFKDRPFHLRCAQLKLAAFVEAFGCRKIEYEETASRQYSPDVSTYLHDLNCRIALGGSNAYSCILNSLDGRQTVAHTFIDEQDNFFCVTEGCMVFPYSAQL